MVAPSPARAQTGTPVVYLDGKGFGHGVGLAQWGAKYMADAGASHESILGTFYPGTTLATVGDQTVRVSVFTSPNGQSTLTFPNGGEIRSAPDGDQAAGFPVSVGPGGSVIVSYDGAYHVTGGVTAQAASEPVVWQSPQGAEQTPSCVLPGITCPPPTTGGGGGSPPPGGGCIVCTTTVPQPATTPPPQTPQPPGTTTTPPTDTTPPPPPASNTSSTPLWAVPADGATTGVAERGRHYRGMIEATADGGPLRLVNQLDVESYLRGMGEVPSSWPLEAIAAQTVAARTYALRAMSFSGELCDYDLCQVYIGADRETAGQNAAVDATTGQVVTYGGALASTVYSADAGGITATTLEGFGSPDGAYPYLTVVRYNTPDPLPWRTEVSLTDIASRFGYQGTVSNVVVSQPGPSGRALQVTIDGSSGPAVVDGRQFASHLGLRSTLFQPTIGTDNNPPPPPADGGAIQALPDDAATIRQAALSGQTVAAQNTADISGMRDWGNSLLSLARSTHAATTDLLDRPATWIALLLVALATALGIREYGMPGPFVPLFADRRTWPEPWRDPPSGPPRPRPRISLFFARPGQAANLPPTTPAALADTVPSDNVPSDNVPSDAVTPASTAAWPPPDPSWTPLFEPPPDADRPAPKDRPTVRLRLRRTSED
ncbi:MAG TPA: SpoIID/LytB domain-containing protein [Acidimicrobiales bacterium]